MTRPLRFTVDVVLSTLAALLLATVLVRTGAVRTSHDAGTSGASLAGGPSH